MPNLGLGLGTNLLRSAATGFPYPKAGRVLDLGGFVYTNAEVPDRSGEGNEAVLYSGRGVNLAGADYVELPDVGATKSITVLVRSSTDTTLYATDDAAQTEDATAALVADGTWQEVTLTFTNAISGKIRLGSDGTSFFSGDLADARCYDASDNLLDQFYLNEHTDTAAGGLDGLPCVGRNGNIGQYVDCAAVVQEGFDSALAGLGAYGDELWFNGVDTSLDYGSPLFPATADFDESFYWYAVENTGTVTNYLFEQASVATDFFGIGVDQFRRLSVIGGAGAAASIIQTDITSLLETIIEIRITRTSGTFELFVNDVSAGTYNDGYAIQQVNANWGASTFLAGGRHAEGLIYGDNVTGTPSGTFNTVAELRTTPPQVLGMDFNQYRWFTGVDTRVSFTKVDFSTGDWSVGATVVPFDDSVIPVIGDGIYWTMQVINSRTALNVRTNLGGTLYTITLDSELTLGQKCVLTVSRAGNTLSAEVNGVTQADTATCGASDTFAADAIGNRSSFYAETLIFNVNINDQAAYKGYGKTPWEDTIGSNDGTESGSFENVLVPESLTTGTDALGNAITPRTNKTFNADGSGRWEVGDAASLVDCKSWSCRYYHTADTADVILDLGTPTIEATALNALTSTGITSPTYYVNGVAGAALSAGWNSICVTTATATDCGPISGDDPTVLESDVKVYNVELTADQVATLP